MKVGKEEIIGLLAAVEWYLGQDQEKLLEAYEEQVQYIIGRLSRIPGLEVRRDFPSEAGQPMPRAEITLDEGIMGISRDWVLGRLENGDPSIDLAPSGDRGIFVNPQTLRPGEDAVIADRIEEITHGKR
jgi:L-seryl-tRNA(Ser) seleniumtransferase